MGRHEAFLDVNPDLDSGYFSAGIHADHHRIAHRGRHYRRLPWYREATAVAAFAVFGGTAIATAIAVLVTQPREGAGEITTAVQSAHNSPNPQPSTAEVRSVEPVSVAPPLLPPPSPPVEWKAPPSGVPQQAARVEPSPRATKAPLPRHSAPPPMSFAPKPVTPPKTAVPGSNKQHHGLLF